MSRILLYIVCKTATFFSWWLFFFQADLSQLLQSASEKAKRGTEFIQNLKKQSEKIGVSAKRTDLLHVTFQLCRQTLTSKRNSGLADKRQDKCLTYHRVSFRPNWRRPCSFSTTPSLLFLSLELLRVKRLILMDEANRCVWERENKNRKVSFPSVLLTDQNQHRQRCRFNRVLSSVGSREC